MAEIKISDLSIGDWVMFTPDKNICVAKPRFTSAPAKITGAYCGKEVCLEVECKREFMAIPLSCISPIPISPEILEKNGYKDCLYYFEWEELYPHSFATIYYENGVYYFGEESGFTRVLEIKFVHQLQHALRLAGVEKEIKV